MSDRPTYPELLKLFYKHSFPDKLGDSCSSMAQAIIYKSNDLWFPAEFTMSNLELSQLSGVKLTNIRRTRQKLLGGCKIDRIPLFTYISGGTQQAGTYKINFTLGATLSTLYTQKQPDSEHIPNTTLHNSTKQQQEVVVDDFPEEPMLTTKSDATIVEGAILAKYRSQIMDNPPSPNALRDALESYRVDQLTEAIERAPAVLKAKGKDTVIDGNYALSTACKWAKNTHWGRVDDTVVSNKPERTHEEKERSRVINHFKRVVADYRSIDGNGRSRTGGTLEATINVMRSYSKWYDAIDNFGAIVGMELDEYETLTNGGTDNGS